MARNPKRPGISYFGKKVETQEIRFDKNVFFEKQKSADANVVSTLATRFDGRQFREAESRRKISLSDASQALNNIDLFTGGMMQITPSSARDLGLPTAATFIAQVLPEDFSAFSFTIINLAASSGPKVTLLTATGITLVGNMDIEAATSGSFKAVRSSSTAVDIFRL